jgi:hypothetical protein
MRRTRRPTAALVFGPLGGLVMVVALAVGSSRASAGGQETVPEGTSSPDAGPTTVDDGSGIETNEPGARTPLPQPVTTVTLPAACVAPAAPAVIFVGELEGIASQTAHFRVLAERSDPTQLLVVAGPADVFLGDDARFLTIDRQYLVAAERAGATELRSKVRQVEPLFGGDQVVGVDDGTARCPAFIDPIVVRDVSGRSIDTGVITGFLDDRRGLLLAVLKPMALVAAVIVGLVFLKRMVLALVRALRRPAHRAGAGPPHR